ncbi:aminoacyl-tRNA hydrolase [Serpentinicella sp. ANB-PHB4]|uniref:aminoacyl-tRNA hydrolase n=1 Tax=Serpentinicella sp. ANB-PHB4 TaxID=3074076 RepID=UPI0028639107|nr:aminoacyl-tRNA hydrolase [Serpentinicella sp. ANB-PHB4]MDR5659188.1 aminoacyl-tRNA hydrolase [Serpentinicella sp. ANB-PHB4]
MYVLVGLGNPGNKYDGTRHNIGFDTIDIFAANHNIAITKLKHKALIGEGRIFGEKVLLVKPQTYMNLSGESVQDIMNYYKVEPEKLMVIYDDIDLNVGAVRIRQKGSAGTHNGMKSILYNIQTDRFPRIRIGVGRPPHGDLVNFVLGKFTKEEVPLMEEAVKKSSDALTSFIKDGIEIAMNKYNG